MARCDTLHWRVPSLALSPLGASPRASPLPCYSHPAFPATKQGLTIFPFSPAIGFSLCVCVIVQVVLANDTCQATPFGAFGECTYDERCHIFINKEIVTSSRIMPTHTDRSRRKNIKSKSKRRVRHATVQDPQTRPSFAANPQPRVEFRRLASARNLTLPHTISE